MSCSNTAPVQSCASISCSTESSSCHAQLEYKDVKELEMLKVPGYEEEVQFGALTHFLYKVEGGDEVIEVATTRPETMLGDTAVAVHPEDPKWVS